MNREILFRGRRKDNGKWVYGNLLVWPDGEVEILRHTILCAEEKGHMDRVTVDPETVGEYTGIDDKNGRRIFEGDIVDTTRGKIGRNMLSATYKYRNTCEPKIVRYRTNIGSCGCCYTEFQGAGFIAEYISLADSVVIGNCWDNPDMVEVERE